MPSPASHVRDLPNTRLDLVTLPISFAFRFVRYLGAQQALVACDFFTAVTARFQVLHVFVVLAVGSRRIVHANVTANPTAEWTLHQLRQALPQQQDLGCLIHDRDSIYSEALDNSIAAMGVKVLKTPPKAPIANAHCE